MATLSQAMIFVRNHFPIIITCFSFSTNIASVQVKDIEQLPSSGNFITSDIPDILFCHSEILNFLLTIYLQNKRKELKIAWTDSDKNSSFSCLTHFYFYLNPIFIQHDVLSTLYLQNEAKCLNNRMASANLYRSIAYSFSSGETFKIKPPDFMWTFFPRALFLHCVYVHARQTRESDFSDGQITYYRRPIHRIHV